MTAYNETADISAFINHIADKEDRA